VKVIDSRFSINDTFITVIAEYMPLWIHALIFCRLINMTSFRY
jgi:hypothetical protein